MSEDSKTCKGCRRHLALSSFGRGNGRCGCNSRCKACCAIRSKQQRVDFPDRKRLAARRWWMKKKFGMTQETYNSMCVKQNNLCAICTKEARPLKGDIRFPLQIDHDHKTGVVRELLCHKCNTILGQCDDDENILKKAIAYLQRHRA